MTRRRAALAVAVPAVLLLGCGGAAPLLHPAHVLPAETFTLGAGVAYQAVGGEAREQIDRAVNAEASGAGIDATPEADLRDGAQAALMLSPGLSPWVGGRVGLGEHLEGGVTYTGRTVRADLRRAFEGKSLALSLGLGLSGKLDQPGDDPTASEGAAAESKLREDSSRGFGADVPLLFGYRSSADVVQSWIGARVAYERVAGTFMYAGAVDPYDFVGSRFAAGGLVGFMVGVKPVWVAVELDAAYQTGRGDFVAADVAWPYRNDTQGRLAGDAAFTGFTYSPSGALIVRF